MKPSPTASIRLPARLPRSRLSALAVAVAIAVPLAAGVAPADAAGLGRMSLLSGIGQPLRAEIDLVSIGRDESGTLSARLASADAYGQAGIEYSGALSSLRFSIQRRAGGQPYVLVTSSQAVSETFLDLLVELSWGSGRLVREYTMLLDPPETRTARAEVDPGQAIVPAQSPPGARRSTPSAASGSAPSGDGVAPTAGTPRRSAPAAPPSSTGADYVVQNGDTALSISRANKPEGTSLEQMLAALYRDNPQAFGGNVNRLMAGVTVKLPDAATSQAIDEAQAGRIVAQSGNFGRYRERLAQAASEAPAARAATPQASGRLMPAVQDNATQGAEKSDRLQLTRPDAAAKAAPGTPTAPSATAARTGAGGPTAEEVAAKDRELQETRSRLAQLQKNVTDLQDLLKLKNQTLADLQKGAATKAADMAAAAPPTPVVTTLAPTAATAPTAPTAPTTQPPPAPVVAPAPAPVVAPPPADATPAPAPRAAPAPTVDASTATPAPSSAPVAAPPASSSPPPAAPQTAWYADLLDNTLALLGLGILALLIIGYGIYTVLRRRKLARFEDSIFVDNSVLHANSVFGTTGGQSVDTANSGFHSNFVPVGGSLPEQSEVDPVAEADVYIAYGREAQAEEILKEALRADAGRHAVRLKLLEIYARRGDAKTFETLASELYATTGGQGNDWAQAAQLGLTVDPDNPLYSQTAAPPARVVSPPVPPASAAAAPAPLSFGAEVMQSVALASSLGNGAEAPASTPDHIRTEPLARTARPTPDSAMDLDFDLGIGGQRPAPLDAAPATTAARIPDLTASESSRALAEPFTASAFGATDGVTRTAVNLPAFHARAEQALPADSPSATPSHNDGFSASDIFGSSIVGDVDAYSETPHESLPAAPAAASARSSDFRADLDHNEFAKTEPFDAFSKINLDLDDPADTSETGDRTEVWQAMATKLDLALAYSDIGDKDGARELLDEVVRSGDQTQAERAKHLITQLN